MSRTSPSRLDRFICFFFFSFLPLFKWKMQKSILISKLESPTIVTPWKSTAYAYETSFPRIHIFTTRTLFQTLYGVPWFKGLVSSVYSAGITRQKYQVAEKVGCVSRFMSIDKNDRYLLLVLRYYTSRVASFEALLKSYNKDTKNQENSNEISVAMLYDKRRIYYGKGDCVQAVSQRVGPTSEMDNEVRSNKRPIPSRLKATFAFHPRRRCSKWLLRPRYSTYRCNFLKIAKFFHATEKLWL